MKARQIKKVTFWSLRADWCTGAYREVDEEITRLCRCVRTETGLKWQLVLKKNQHEWDYCLDVDQECLDNI